MEDLQSTLEQRARVLTSPHSAPEPGVSGFRQLWMLGLVETQVNSCGIFIHFSISTAVEFCPSIVAHEGSETLKTEGREIYVGSFLSERFKGKVVFVGKVCSSFDIGLKGIRARHFV